MREWLLLAAVFLGPAALAVPVTWLSEQRGPREAWTLVLGWLGMGTAVGWALTRSDYPAGTPGAEPSVWAYPQQLFAPLILFGVPALIVGWRARKRVPTVDDWTERVPGVVLTALAAAFGATVVGAFVGVLTCVGGCL
jgi:hypothetical protein